MAGALETRAVPRGAPTREQVQTLLLDSQPTCNEPRRAHPCFHCPTLSLPPSLSPSPLSPPSPLPPPPLPPGGVDSSSSPGHQDLAPVEDETDAILGNEGDSGGERGEEEEDLFGENLEK